MTSTQEAPDAAPAPRELTFTEYETLRRAGKPVPKDGVASAPAAKADEQKHKSKESDPEETEEEEESDDAEAEGEESDDSEQEAKTDAKDAEKPKKKGGFQRRIDKLSARSAAAEQRALAAEAELARLRSGEPSKAKQVEQPKATDEAGKPKADDFETYAEYTEALTDWKLEQRERARTEAEAKTQFEREQQAVLKAHAERVKSFTEKTTDFMEQLENVDDIPFSAAFQKEIVTSENGPELMYALAQDRAEYERLQKLGPTALARELGKFEAKLALSKSSEAKKPEPKKITQAPKPPTPVGKSPGKVEKSISDPDLSFSDYERLRRAQMRRK